MISDSIGVSLALDSTALHPQGISLLVRIVASANRDSMIHTEHASLYQKLYDT